MNDLIYAILIYFVCGINLYRGFSTGATMNYIFAAVWFVLGSIYFVRFLKSIRKKK